MSKDTRAAGKCVKNKSKEFRKHFRIHKLALGASLTRRGPFAVFRKAERGFYEVSKPRSRLFASPAAFALKYQQMSFPVLC